MKAMDRGTIAKAPGWRRSAAAALDLAIVGAAAWLLGRGGQGAAAKTGRARVLRMIPAEALREQVRTPGQRLLGLRTVDRRTGERVAPWRTVLLTAVAVGGRRLAERFTPAPHTPEQERGRERFLEELHAIHQRHPLDSPERSAELGELHARYPGTPPVHVARMMAPALAAGLIASRLRRRLAPTVEVLAPPR